MREFEGHRSKAFDEDDLVEGEEEGEKEEVGDKWKEEETEKSMEVEKCVDLENSCIVAKCALGEVEDALGACIKNIRRLKETVKKGKGGNQDFLREMYGFYVILVGTKEKNLMVGEWMEKKLSFLQTHCKGTQMDIIVSVIKECMRDVYPNLPIFPSKEGYKGFSESGVSGVSVVGDVVESGVWKFEEFEMDADLLQLKEEKYRIKLKVIDEKRWFLWSFETCEKKFRSQRTADACINYHLGLLYKCKPCEFVTHNYDSSRNHKCFAYMGGRKRKSETTPMKGKGKKVKKSGEGKETEGKEKEGKDEEGWNIKKEEEIIVIE